MYEADYLVIGSGIAGLSFALKAARNSRVTVVTKRRAEESNTSLAQGGIACVTAPGDSEEEHVRDTLEAGAGHCNEAAVRLMVQEARACIDELLELGVTFNRKDEGWDLHREGGHSRHRILHYFDMTGREIENALLRAVRQHPNIQLYENHFVLDLITGKNQYSREFSCSGAYVLSEDESEILAVTAKNTVLCSGGAGQVYPYTTNPMVSTGDGIAMAVRAGVRLADMEFIQFHPTALYTPSGSCPLITEALRGAGAELVNADGEAFMFNYHKLGSLAPRDIVARAITEEMTRSGHRCVYLSLEHCRMDVEVHFPQVAAYCHEAGIDLKDGLIPIVPAAHYLCGGVATDLRGRTSIEHLYAFGEVACTGVHGANRLASNSLLEALVFARQAFLDASCQVTREHPQIEEYVKLSNKGTEPDPDLLKEIRQLIQKLMWQEAGIVRTRQGLEKARMEMDAIIFRVTAIYSAHRKSIHTAELLNLATVAGAILSAAASRKENCGLHYIEIRNS